MARQSWLRDQPPVKTIGNHSLLRFFRVAYLRDIATRTRAVVSMLRGERMERCSHCGADTELYVNGVPLCVKCDKRFDGPMRISGQPSRHQGGSAQKDPALRNLPAEIVRRGEHKANNMLESSLWIPIGRSASRSLSSCAKNMAKLSEHGVRQNTRP
jgi:hypothetical protein